MIPRPLNGMTIDRQKAVRAYAIKRQWTWKKFGKKYPGRGTRMNETCGTCPYRKLAVYSEKTYRCHIDNIFGPVVGKNHKACKWHPAIFGDTDRFNAIQRSLTHREGE